MLVAHGIEAQRAPQGIVTRHSSNQLPDFRAQAWPAQPTARPPAPVQAPTLAMPADHCLRLHDLQLTFPSLRPEPTHPDPQDPVPVARGRLWLAAKQRLELVSRDEVLEGKVAAGTTAINQDAKQHQEEAQHRRGSISGHGAPSCGRSGSTFCRPSPLTSIPGVAELTAGEILAEVGDAWRFRTKAQFAMANGTAPLPASSGRTNRHRLNRGGNRQLNRIIHFIALTQVSRDPQGRAYYLRKQAEGRTRKDALRCLKRRISDRLFQVLRTPAPVVDLT